MRIVKLKLCEITTKVIPIGFEGEQNHTQVIIDASPILTDYPDATVALAVKPPVGNIYPKAAQKSGNNVVWDVSASDCANEGSGEYQITFNDGDDIIKSFIGYYKVYNSLIGNGSAPDPVEDWLEDAQAVLGSLEEITASAETLAPGAQATAEVTDVGGHKNLAFGIPAGQQGEPGVDGQDGEDGFSPTVTVTDITGGHRISITDATGTNTFDVLNGTNGTDGQDGYSPTVTVTDITGGHRVSVTDATGTKTFDVMDGQDGHDGTDGVGVPSGGTTGQVLAKKSGTDYDTEWKTPSGGVSDVQVNGTSVVSQGVANVPIASDNDLGVVKTGYAYGVKILTGSNGGKIAIDKAPDANIKAGTHNYYPIVPVNQHVSTFYGLAKIAGADEKDSSLTAGTYSENAKSAISNMLNAPVSVSGSTPSITAKSGIRYICGEVSTLSITAPASGCIDVVFESGSTATVLTVTSAKTGVSAIKWAGGFDPTSLDANTTYEVNILDGEFGVVGKWT